MIISQIEIFVNTVFTAVYNKISKFKGVSAVRLKDIREDRDMKQIELAEMLHIKQNTLSQYENGLREMPFDILIQVALIFNTSTDYILGLTDETAPYKRSSKYENV